jgi:hypothetical protein
MRPARIATAAVVLAALAALAPLAAAAGGVTIVRQHLDAGRVQYSGMDINGDGIPDSIRVDGIKQTLAYFAGDRKMSLKSFDPATLPEDERRFVPDVLVETDLDGDEIADLLLYNRDYLMKFAGNEPVFLRILGESIYIGQPKGVFRELSAAGFTEEARARVLEKARAIVLEKGKLR